MSKNLEEKSESALFKQLQQLEVENKSLKQKLEKIKEIIKIDIEECDNMTLQEFSEMCYFTLSPKGKVLRSILDTVMKEKGMLNNELKN